MKNKQLLEIAFAKLLDISLNITPEKNKNSFVNVVYMDDSVETGISAETFECSDLKDTLFYRDKLTASAKGIIDASLAYNADYGTNAVFEPGEGVRNPLALSLCCGDIKEIYPGYKKIIYLFSCIPNYTEKRYALLEKENSEDKNYDERITRVEVDENSEAIWNSWMRIFWGRNWKTKYS